MKASGDRRAMLAALSGLASRGRRSSLDDKLPEDKRGGLTIIIGGSPVEVEPEEGEAEEAPEDAAEAVALEEEDEDDDYMG